MPKGCVLATVVLLLGLAYLAGGIYVGDCNYHALLESRSPDGRYIAAYYHIDCGPGSQGTLVTLRSAWLPDLRIYPSALGDEIAVDASDMERHRLVWEGEKLVLMQSSYPARLKRTQWRDIEIESRAFEVR